MFDTHKIKPFGAPIVRIGMSIVFLWFGISQIMKPGTFTGWLPQAASIVPLSPETLVLMNGVLETILGIMLLIGVFTRVSGLLLGLNLITITFTVGIFSQLGIRDLGLTLATISIFFTGPDRLCLETILLGRRKPVFSKKSGNRLKD